MADAVSRPAEPVTEARGGGLQKDVVVHVFVIGLQQVVIDVLHGDLGPGFSQAEGFQFKHDQGARGVLLENLIDLQADLDAGLHLARDEMFADELLADVLRFHAAASYAGSESYIRIPGDTHIV
jgi:hypothetical protein